MQLIGETVQHKTFGRGVVTGCRADALTVLFPDNVQKKFIYPDAFQQHFLSMVSAEGKEEVAEEVAHRKAARTRHYEKLEKRMEKEGLLANLRISPCSQAAFNVEEGCDPFRTWSISTGVYVGGYSKGLPRIPERMKPNSLCLLTACPAGQPERNRQILGAFMVQEDFMGSACADGQISAHPDYRIRLEQPLDFWPYVSDQPEKKRWGKASFRYLNNKLVEGILYDMREQLRHTDQAGQMADFYEYYCKKNQLPSRMPKE